jgi:hypothetical protein
MPTCAWCQREIELIVKVGRQDDCPHCHRDLHACVQCRHYDRAAHNKCREPQSEWVPDKERANFCGYFEFGREVAGERDAEEKAKNGLEALFKK